MFQKTYRLRLILLATLSLGVYGAIEARLFHLQVRHNQDYVAAASDQQNRVIVLKPSRGDILDCNGTPLAKSSFRNTIVLDTRQMDKPSRDLIKDLAKALRRSEDRVREYWKKPGYKYVYRMAEDEVSTGVQMVAERHQLPPGLVVFERESKRIYPYDRLACHIIGFTKPDEGGDNIGQAGIEELYDRELKGAWSKLTVPAYSYGKPLAPIDRAAIDATYGNTLVLTLNSEIQMFAENVLRRQVNAMAARGGSVIVIDVPTGGILAMANCPDFDLNDFGRYATEAPETLRNRALTDPYEIGSVMKIFTTSILLDQGLLSVNETVNGMGGSVQIHGRVIKDVHPLGAVPFPKAFAESSNVVMALLSERIEPSLYYKSLFRLGAGRDTGIDLPGEGHGKLRNVDIWTAQSRASLAIGYETSLTPMQVASALQSIGNDGKRLRPHLVKEIRTQRGDVVKRIEPELIDRTISPAVAATVRELMQGVVEGEDGTGFLYARIPGYSVGGKTGTAVKQLERDGRKQYLAGFAGLVPLSKPRIAIYVCIDEPQNAKYGGQVSGPVFKEVATNALHLLQIPPDRPEEKAQADAAALAALPAIPTAQPTPDPMPYLPYMDEYVGADTGPKMPNLEGLTIVDVLERLAKLGIHAKIRGSGVAVSQEPPAGAPVPESGEALVVFAHPSEAARTRQAQVAVAAH